MDLTQLPPWQLQLEITEQAVVRDEAAAKAALSALRATGVRLALDDFGTGYSGLAWLRQLPVHALKIDGSFVDGLRHRHADPVDRRSSKRWSEWRMRSTSRSRPNGWRRRSRWSG